MIKIYQGRIDSYNGTVKLEGKLTEEDRLRIDRMKVFIVPEEHYLYDWIKDEYLPKREDLESKLKARDKNVKR